MSDKYVHLAGNLYMWYKNYREVPRTAIDMNNERYEGYMRNDFSVKPKKTESIADRVEVVRIL